MKIGYARTSILNVEADFEPQLGELKQADCEEFFTEQVSTVGERQQLDAALAAINEGDTLVVTGLDRLARSTAHLVQITDALGAKGAGLHILDLGVDTGTAKGRYMLKMLSAIGQFEQELTAERQREGVAKARAKGKYKGRKPTARAKTQDVLRLKDQGVGATEISKKLDIGRASVYRIINDRKAGRKRQLERHVGIHPLKKEIDAWAGRATFDSQDYSGYGGHVAMLSDFASVQAFVMHFLDDNGNFPKDSHAVPKLKKYGSGGKFRVQFPKE